jgi:bis(5'-adenosyl)-triphosphatase
MIEGEEGDVGKHLAEKKKQDLSNGPDGEERGRFPAVDADESRKPRSEEEMQKEAQWLAQEMAKDSANGR